MLSGKDGEGASLGVQFGRVVLVPQTVSNYKVFADVPLILRERVVRFAADIGEGGAELEVLIGQAHQEVRKIVTRPNAGRRPIKVKLAIHIIIVVGIVLIGGEEKAVLHGVLPLQPGERVGGGESVVDLGGWPLRAEAERQTAIQADEGRTGGLVRCDAYSQLTRRGQ